MLAVVLVSLLAFATAQAPLAEADQTVVTIPDPALRACLLNKLKLSSADELTEDALAGLTSLLCRRDGSVTEPIRDLTGIGHLTGATSISLIDEELTDVSPLAGLTRVTDLTLSRCGVTDASPLGALTGLTDLNLAHNPLIDLRFLSSFGLLESLAVDDVPADPAPIANLTSLELLKIGGNSSSDYAFLTSFPSLVELYVNDDTATTLGPLGHPAALTKLTVQGARLGDISAIAELDGLKEIRLHVPTAPSLEPLAGLMHLESLEVASSAISNLEPLSGLSSIKRLELTNDKIRDLSPLAGLTGLETLRVPGNKLADLPDFSAMTQLTTLDLSANELTSLHLAGLPSLVSVRVDGNALTELGLADLPTLTTVAAARNQLTSPGAFTNLPHLSTLSLSGNRLTNLTGVAGLPALAELTAADNQIKNLEGLTGLPAITTLDAQNNQIADASPLAQLGSLHTIRLNNNQLTSLAPIAGLPLRLLNASQNRITQLPTFTRATALAELDVANNQIKDSSHLAGLPALALVDLRNNQLTDVSPVATAPMLATLLVSGNAITDLSAFAGTPARIQADFQSITVPDNAPLRTPVPITLRGPDGKIPDITHDATIRVADGTLNYTTPGQHTIGFHQTVGESVFSGKLTRRAGPNAAFTKVNTPQLDGSANVGSAIGAWMKPWTPTVDYYSWQWYVDGKAIKGANDWLYTPSAKDLGHRLRASVTGAKDGYVTVTKSTRTTAKVVRGSFRTETPKIVGATRTGARLSIAMKDWSPKPEPYTYRWYRNDRPVQGATKPTFTLTAADLGKHISVQVTGRATAFESGWEFSMTTRAITQGPVRSAQPRITGSIALGNKLGTTRGTWGPGKITFGYQWLRDGKAIPKAHGRTYSLTSADSGHVLAVAVTGDRTSYTAVSRISDGIAIP